MAPGEQIFSIGDGSYRQVALRADGVWFVRFRRLHPKLGIKVWGKWERLTPNRRPDYAWYNPGAGRAKLPKE